MTSSDLNPSKRPTKVDVPKELPKVSMDVQIVLWYLDSGCSKHMTGDRSQLINFINKFLGTVKFGNDHVAKIMGYGDYQIWNVMILRVYYVEGLGHNLLSIGQFCDLNLEVAFHQHTCYICNLEGVDLLTRSRRNNLYTLSLRDMMASSPICLLSKASKTKSWLWHRRLSNLNFGTLNHLARHGLVRGLSKLKFEKDHLCSACAMGKGNKKPYKPKSKDTNTEKLYLLHMDLCGPMRVARVNGKNIDNETEFVNQTLREYYEKVGILLETSVARSSLQNSTPVISNDVKEDNHDLDVAHINNDSFFGVKESPKTPTFHDDPLHESLRKDSTSLGSSSNMRQTHTPFESLDFDELTSMASKHSSSEPTLHEMTLAIISSGFVPNPNPSTPFVPPSRTDWGLLCQPLFDELLTPLPSIDHLAPKVITSIAKVTPVISNDVKEDNHDLDVAHINNDSFFGVEESPKTPTFHDDPLHESLRKDSTS
nr:retrovirus-related Pol polyprotein from transposon TNT 1-94 [Tanacetum cinerariifolium]